MNILYLGNFRQSWSTETYVAHALESLGHDVRRVPVDTASTAHIRWLIRKRQPEVLLLSKRSPTNAASIIEYARHKGVFTACWLWDLLWGYRQGVATMPQMNCDLLLSTDDGHGDRWPAQHATLRQGVHEPEHRSEKRRYTHDVAFVGGTRTDPVYRRRLIAWLQETYGKRFVWHTHTRGLDLNEALAQVRIVVGDSYPSPGYWSNRVYEITGRGGFLLHPATPGLEEEFPDLITYDRAQWRTELPRLIEQYLDDSFARETIRVQCFEDCPTYKDRCECLTSILRTALSNHTRPCSSKS